MHPPIPAIRCDYGFFNCKTLEVTCIHVGIYEWVLERTDRLDLHRACVAGRLFEFASTPLEMEDRWRFLMWNPYSLSEFLVGELGEGQDRIEVTKGGKDGTDGDADNSPQVQTARQKGWCEVM